MFLSVNVVILLWQCNDSGSGSHEIRHLPNVWIIPKRISNFLFTKSQVVSFPIPYFLLYLALLVYLNLQKHSVSRIRIPSLAWSQCWAIYNIQTERTQSAYVSVRQSDVSSAFPSSQVCLSRRLSTFPSTSSSGLSICGKRFIDTRKDCRVLCSKIYAHFISTTEDATSNTSCFRNFVPVLYVAACLLTSLTIPIIQQAFS